MRSIIFLRYNFFIVLENAKSFKAAPFLNISYLKQITKILEDQNLNYRLLDALNVTSFQDYQCCFLLIEDSLLYVISIGETDIVKSQLLFKNLQKAAKLDDGDPLTLIMDATQLHNMPASASEEIDLFDIPFRKYWTKIIFIEDDIAKRIADNDELHQPEHLKGVEKVNKAETAIVYALTGKRPDMSLKEQLETLSKSELIDEIVKLKTRASLEHSKESLSANQIVEAITDFTWKKEDPKILEFNKEHALSPVYNLLNSIITDFKELKQEFTTLKEEFYQRLQFQVGEIMYQEASLRAIFDSLDSSVWMVDEQFNLLAFNSNFCKHLNAQYGINPKVGMNVLEQVDLSEHYDKTIDRISASLKGKEANYRDYYREKGNIIKVVDSKIFPVVVNKDIRGVACLTSDITEGYEAQEKIKDSEHIIASVNKNISEAIYRSSQDQGLIFVNEAFVNMFGFDSKEELYQHSELNSIYANPEDREKLGDLLIKKKEVTNLEVQFRKKNGLIFTGLISSMVSEGEKGGKFFDGAIRDVTAIKSAQEKLKKQNRELKKLNTELDSFVYSASHDLKAPLSSVKGLINLAKKETDKDRLADYLDLVEKSINKLDDFIKDIVDLSRNARQDVQSELIDFNDLIKDTLDNYQYLENYDKIIKKVNVEQELAFYSDKRRLKVIFNNIISNAIRYFNPYIDQPFVEINIKIDHEKAFIKISDNGLGIDNQYLNKIFDMFFRASNNSKGTGIGLYIVKETIQKVQGEIKVKSKVAKGTTFEVSIPNLQS